MGISICFVGFLISLHFNVDLYADLAWDRHRAEQIADAVNEVIAAREIQVAVISVEQRPDSVRVLFPHEIQFFAVGLKEAARSLVNDPASARVYICLLYTSIKRLANKSS